jgi:glycosyltransferase involved in cell wall biosynthesis
MLSDVSSRSPVPIYVNGRFLGRPLTGVERFARGILHQVDAILDAAQAESWTILVPPGVSHDQGFRRLRIRTTGRLQGHAWEQIDLFKASRDGTLISPCNSGPILHSRQLAVIHDALVYRFPEGFSRSYGRLHRTLGRLLARRAHLATVSNFSRLELAAVLKRPAETISIIGNAVDHIETLRPDQAVLDRFSLRHRPYFLFIGSPASNKNLARAVEAFQKLGRDDVAFVLVGKAGKAFSHGLSATLPPNVIQTGRLEDAEIAALYGNAEALVFPSLYEGFGIPPLEAMSLACPVLAADIPVLREVCGDSAYFFDPYDVTAITQAMHLTLDGKLDRESLRLAGKTRAGSFSWENSARTLLRIVSDMTALPE